MSEKIYTADEVEWMLRGLDDEITAAAKLMRNPGWEPGFMERGQASGLDQAARVVANMAHYIHDANYPARITTPHSHLYPGPNAGH